MIEIKFTGNTMADITEELLDFLRMKDPADFSEKQEDEGVTEMATPEETTEEEPTVEESKTQEDVTALVKAKIDEGKSKEIKALLKKYNAAKVTALEEEHFDAFYEDLEEL